LQKGVALSHRAVLNQLAHLATRLNLNKSDKIISWLPLYHDMGLIACFILPLVMHIHVVMQSPTDWVLKPGSMLQLASEYRCTLCWMPNFAFQFLTQRVAAEDKENLNLSSLRAMISCSEPVRFQSMEAFKAAYCSNGLAAGILHSSYAMAENTFAVTQTHVDTSAPIRTVWADSLLMREQGRIEMLDAGDPRAVPIVSSGRCLPNNSVRIMTDDGLELPEGRLGELVVRSDSIFEGYYNRPDLTAKALQAGWYRTRDTGFVLDGEVFVIGRRDDTIIIGGRNLYPHDIEEIVFQSPAIHAGRAVALGIYSPDIGTEELVIVAEVNDPADLDHRGRVETEIRRLVYSEIGVAPRWVFLVPPKWIIKSSAGKPARSTTRMKLLAEHPEIDYSKK
jgi:fatty-acyl-CoA synthase